MEALDWEIDDESERVDTDTFEGTCFAIGGSDTYTASCTINRGSGDISGSIIDIDYSTAEME
jgi:hypothetical protein